jgi:hypothetical protein
MSREAGSPEVTTVMLSREVVSTSGGAVGWGAVVATAVAPAGLVGVGSAMVTVAVGWDADVGLMVAVSVAAGPPQATIRTVNTASRPGIPTPIPTLNFGIIDIGISCHVLRIRCNICVTWC